MSLGFSLTALPTLLAGAVLYAGMYAQPNLAVIGLAPVGWTPCRRGCSSWEVSVGSSLLSTRTRP